MAENEQTGGNNLDDFFAKKDKSKKKTKSSKFTVDDILQAKTENEEKSQKVRSSKKKEKDASRSDKSLGVKTEGDDEEWNEVEEEAEKDYTGLRVQNLQISGKDDEERQELGSTRNEEDDGESKEGAQGPWKPVPAVAVPTPPFKPTQVPEPVKVQDSAKETPKSTGKYVPPQMRRAYGDQPVTSSGSSRPARGKKTAPDVNSQEDFPTLGSGSAADPCEGGGAFEKIRGGARPVEDPATQHSKLTLDNKFDALDTENS